MAPDPPISRFNQFLYLYFVTFVTRWPRFLAVSVVFLRTEVISVITAAVTASNRDSAFLLQKKMPKISGANFTSQNNG